ncbi:MAG: PAS domain S-box protein, partial [Sphaerospermopsis sp.]|nr:PAS domain S-box protein [Sphaerospermopsis sp.]
SHTDNLIEKIRVYEIKMLAARAQGGLLESIQIGLQLLELLGINFPQEPTLADIGQALQQTIQLWKSHSISSLLDAPVMSNPLKLAAMQILTQMVPSAYQAAPQLLPLLIFKQIELSIVEGNCNISPFSYADYGLVLCGIVGDLDAGYEFGQLALKLLERFQVKTTKSRTYFVVHGYTSHWKESLSSRLVFFQEGYQIGLETGDLESSTLNACIYSIYTYFAGHELPTLAVEMENYRQTILQLKQESSLNFHVIYHQTVLNLLGRSEYPCRLEGEVFVERQTLPILQAANNRTAIYYLYYNKTVLCYLLGEYQQAADCATLAESYVDSIVGMFAIPLLYFYKSLVDLALFIPNSATEQTEILNKVGINQTKLENWANHAPMNHQHKFDLVEAEKYRVLGENYQAGNYYDSAISGAKENGYIQEEALANELAAKFYLNCGKKRVAAGYMQEAYYCYARWGAKAKTDDLEKRYPDLLRPILHQPPQCLNALETLVTVTASNPLLYNSTTNSYSSSTNINATLDFTAILKASQALSSTIQLDELLRQLTQIILQNSGGDRCVLILPEQNEEWYVKAIATAEKIELCSQPLENNPNIPNQLIQYVKNTQEVVVIDDLKTDLPVICEYLFHRKPKSVLCLPLLNQGHLIGILYLKNHFTSGAFTQERILILNFLCTQAAISLENARLYAQEREKIREISEREAEYRSIFESVNDGLSISDLETGKIVATNPVNHQIFGYSLEEFSLLTPYDFLDIDSVHLFSNFLETMKSGKEFYCQGIGKRKDNSLFDFEVKAIPFMYRGKLHGLSILRDISEQQATQRERIAVQKALEESNTLLNSLLQTIPDVFFAKDLKCSYIAINANGANFLGKSIAEIIGKNDTDFFAPDFAKIVMVKDQEIMSKEITESLEESLEINGTPYTYLSIKTPLRNSQGDVIGLIGLSRDITDRKKAEAAVIEKSQELEQALQELQQAQLQMVQNEKMASLGNLVAGVAHEINNPIGFLNGSITNAKEYVQDLLGHLELYQQNYPQPATSIQENAEDIDLEFLIEDLGRLLDAMAGANHRIKSISNSLRTFSRADTDHKVSANLHEGIDSTILILKYRLKGNENRPAIKINKEYGEIPQIECFPGQLNQVFMNILANAIDVFDEMAQNRTFAELQAHPQQITIRTTISEKKVCIRIQDNGKGMSEEVKSKIFDHLFTTKGVGKGTGLGLAIAKQIVEQTHLGKLSCNSVLGEGTEFVIEIPL